MSEMRTTPAREPGDGNGSIAGHQYLDVVTERYTYMTENVVASFVLELKDGEVPRCHFLKHLQFVVLCVLDEVIVQGRLPVPETYTCKMRASGKLKERFGNHPS